MKKIIDLMEKGLIPDYLIRRGIRLLNRSRLKQENTGDPFSQLNKKMNFIQELRRSPIAIETDAANRQHYEIPPDFFKHVMGKYMKYSCCLWNEGTSCLTDAEKGALELVIERSEISDGMSILDLGCGWGSMSLYLSQKFPTCRITAVSNSADQRKYIEGQCSERGISNLTVITDNINDFDPGKSFDRVVSIEMFEHMRNYQELLKRVASWLNQEGKIFIHIFTHKKYAYFFETEGEDNWMGRYFFTGGLMPSDDLLLYFQDDILIEKHWRLSGTHYQKTAEQWLLNMDKTKTDIMHIFNSAYGPKEAKLWFQRWRIFFMACSELWGYRNGTEWFVSHYLFRKRA